ncbi:DUF3168 domain-containing protein [Roseibium polysiphoniae]|uniref:DUF3168 domain-containing protein n=1 Tax=Roseibium polysiphoniae TaxID=2571221 RepID=A0A944GRM8_9HYPH|nr:DUF3168 domain-containing protein [Roseibium polysiphoniae]MBS8258745.1 DUF3168 domain-containing protein [Roseibium polysiphoniae]
MSTHSQLALRGALFSRLAADATLTDLVGAGRIFDAPPRGQAFPFLVLETLGARPLLNLPEEGLVHDLRLAALSRKASRDEALAIIQRASVLLMEPDLHLSGHRLVGLQVSEMSSRLLRDGRTFRAELSLRVVTEPDA